MRKTLYYKVAGHIFSVNFRDELLMAIPPLLENYTPFVVASCGCDEDLVFSLELTAAENPVEYVEETRQVDEGQEIVCGKDSEGRSVFDFFLGAHKAGTLLCDEGYENFLLQVEPSQNSHLLKFAINNALMVSYALATACKDTALFHSAVVERNNRGYMFLGKSGTGKSTHARMWLSRFDDAELLNDDNPVVRLEQDGLWVYGSPWSGKTPCYKNRRVLLGGIVDLSQAPQNKIRPIKGIEAYMALVVSISGMRWNKRIADGLHATENRLAQQAHMFHLDCLPNENAAEVCYDAVRSKEVAP